MRMVKPIRPSPYEMSPYESIPYVISGMKIFQNLFGMNYIQMVTGKWYENYSDRIQIDLV